ncbi:DUF1212-domain-containing protein [Rhodofomes roseus]|uniref:DUF1212-domain-containing protein n=1 Tax=Rhodofomes roseus TaxID=34475 RepID=A0ABQ8KX31_9APHY|nr:DUF1212-domain-containing protein [Rhodofomes roseus]KAH9843858.1 DUF1212-domain-containing protein [Rhodofomes roseus]
MTREKAHNGPEDDPPLSRFSAPRTNSGISNRSDDSDADPELLDPHDPKATGRHPHSHNEGFVGSAEEAEMMSNMTYVQRKKYMSRVKIEWNVSPIYWREQFLIRLAGCLMTFGAPSHRIEAQLVSAARVLEIEAEFVHIPGLIMCSFGDKMRRASDLRFVKCAGSLDLGSLHTVHVLYRRVVHDELSAQEAAAFLEHLLTSRPAYRRTVRIIFAFFLSAMICPLAFGGSIIDMWIAGVTGVFLSVMQVQVAARSAMYAAVYEITVSMIVSFASRGLSAIRSSHLFCYTAISSSGIVGILPGYLILSSSLELASKNIVCGSVRMVYALIYTLFLGFALQIGSDLFLVCDKTARAQLLSLQERLSTVAIVSGTFVTDNASSIAYDLNQGRPISGTFTFTNYTKNPIETIDGGCYRNVYFPWWLQPFPWWTQFILVPLFSILSSMANLQPFWTREMFVMVLISCVAYAANKAADHFIFNRSDIVSAIGAFVVGLMGNLYSRKLNGTAFTSMVTGVLFLVPSGLSAAGGITAQGSGIDIGAAMISVTIGITVGLFMSQALVYMFGSRKNAAVFSF